jgi:hypothetical protein
MLESTLQSGKHGLTLRGPPVAHGHSQAFSQGVVREILSPFIPSLDPLPGSSVDLPVSSATPLAPSDPNTVPLRPTLQSSSSEGLIVPRSSSRRNCSYVCATAQ